MRPLEIGEMTAAPNNANGNASNPVADGSEAFDQLTRREWLQANGVGGFASGTVSGASARRYHALLVAALRPPLGRMTLLGRVEEEVTLQGERYNLASNVYPGAVAPDGWRYVSEFAPWPVPTWTLRLPGGATVVKRIFMARRRNTVYVTYTLREATAMATLTLTPLAGWKDYHSEMHPWANFPTQSEQAVGGWTMQATPDAPPLRLFLQGAVWTKAGWWHKNIIHERERERGQDYLEDLYCPATASVPLKVGQTVAFIATAEADEPDDATLALAEIVSHQANLLVLANADSPTGRDLALAADPFVIVAPGVRTTALAGYPWFTDWGRDTMIALPGLCLRTGRVALAREILLLFAGYVSEGMIPNRFPDASETPDYNTVDATLWFVHACNLYRAAAPDDSDFTEQIAPVLRGIIAAHIAGTRYGIGVDPADDLLAAGVAGVQLTWMDAKVGDWVVTPRIGKPVEINALWINALRIAAAWSSGGKRRDYAARATRAEASFVAKFVRPGGEGLYDLLHPDGTPDLAIRPNQVIAAALPTSPLTAAQTADVLRVATGHLLTPYGLRTLSPHDPAYRGRYGGPTIQRDGAYHQGTVWPWLLGPYIDVYRRVHGPAADIAPLVAPLIAHLREFGVGGIAEIFDGDAPHTPNGCPWQAWSIAELLRVGAA